MSEIDLSDKFPELQPLGSAPALFSINGCGLILYGSRDLDGETGTYVKTRCLSLVFVPLLALGSYRVADADRGWYFIGKEPLSGVARIWNAVALALILVGGSALWWRARTSSPDYLAGQQVAAAERHLADGRVAEARDLLVEVAMGTSSRATGAADRLRALLQGPGDAEPQERAALLAGAVDLALAERWSYPPESLVERATALAQPLAVDDPFGALAILAAVDALEVTDEASTELRRRCLQRGVERRPDDPALASGLAEIHETAGELEECERLLRPHAERLGESEGARILGQILAARGELDGAHALLEPYVEARLDAFHAAEKELERLSQAAQDRALSALQDGAASESFYLRYQGADTAAQDAMVWDYVEAELEGDPRIAAARAALMAEAGVVPAALNLGVVSLRRAQALADPDRRLRELEKAEETFLAIRGFASESPEYRLNLAQVYHWMGRPDDAQRELDELLAASDRSTEMLLGVATTLRYVGDETQARALFEEAYEGTSDPDWKHAAALARSLAHTDVDDKIEWLRRADPANPSVTATLDASLGHVALQEGRGEVAAEHFRESIDAFARLPENPATLNNGALSWFGLFHATGDARALERAMTMLDEAVRLQPTDAILLNNAAHSVLGAALRDLVDEVIDLRVLKLEADVDHLSYLYRNAEGRRALAERVRGHAGIERALGYVDQVMVLSPKRPNPYAQALSIHRFTRDREALAALWERLASVELDHEETIERRLAWYTGADDEKLLGDMDDAHALTRTRLAAAREQSTDAVTLAVAIGDVIEAAATLWAYGRRQDPDELVHLAEEAHGAAPSAATRSMLHQALAVRASARLADRHPAYAAMVERSGRAFGGGLLMLWALNAGGDLAGAVRDDPDFRRIVDLAVEERELFPETPTIADWAVLRTTRPDLAEEVAQRLRADEVSRIGLAIDLRLRPAAANPALYECWALELAGRPEEGREVLRGCAAQGVPMPVDLD